MSRRPSVNEKAGLESESTSSSGAGYGSGLNSEGKEQWVETQKKTFTKWLNNHMKKKGFSAFTDVAAEFDTGIKLMQLIHALYDLPIPKHNANPRLRPIKADNIQLAFNMVEAAKIKTNFLKSTHLLDHDLKMILGMIWAVILDYSIKGIKEEDTNAKDGLLLWVKKKTAGYRDVDPPGISNFSTSWKNGLAFCALIHKHQPQLIDYDALDKNNAAENLEKAFSVAESLGIPRLLDVEDLLCDKPDERSVMTQVSEYWQKFSKQDTKEVAARRAAKFLAFTKSMNQLQHNYEELARALLEWVNNSTSKFATPEFGTTITDAERVLDELRQFILSEKPQKSAEKMDLESKYALIQTELRVNGRPAWVCPAELEPEAIDAAFDELWTAEKNYAKQARENRFKFVTKEESKLSEEKVKEFSESFKYFDKDGDNQMIRDEFKAACSALSIAFKDDQAMEKEFRSIAKDQEFINEQQWIEYNTNLATDKDTPDQIKASFRILANEGAFITADQLLIPPLTAEDVEYLKIAMPPAADGSSLDYNTFIDNSFEKTQ